MSTDFLVSLALYSVPLHNSYVLILALDVSATNAINMLFALAVTEGIFC